MLDLIAEHELVTIGIVWGLSLSMCLCARLYWWRREREDRDERDNDLHAQRMRANCSRIMGRTVNPMRSENMNWVDRWIESGTWE